MNDYPEKRGHFEKVCIELYKEGLFIKWFDRFPEVRHTENSNVVPYFEDEENQDEYIDIEDEEILQNLYTTVSQIITDTISIEDMQLAARQKQKTKYMCNGCQTSLWGKPHLDIKCNSCQIDFKVVGY